MNRREFIIVAAAATALPVAAFAVEQPLSYQPGMVEQLLADGKTVLVDFKADWCATCAAQERIIQAVRERNSLIDDNIVFVNVNWDNYSNGKLAKRLNIPRRSTLVLLRGNEELGRIVAGTSAGQIRELIELGLPAV